MASESGAHQSVAIAQLTRLNDDGCLHFWSGSFQSHRVRVVAVTALQGAKVEQLGQVNIIFGKGHCSYSDGVRQVLIPKLEASPWLITLR